MAGVGMRIEGLTELQAKLTHAARSLTGSPLDQALLRGAALIRGQAQLNVTAGGVGLRSGKGDRLRGSMHEFLAGHGQAVVAVPVSYAAYLEFGTRPHFIMAKKPGGVLRFEIGGEVIFRHIVYHPGTRPYRFLGQARDTMEPKVVEMVRQVYAGPLNLGGPSIG